jgi:hypothetical protein
MNNSDLFGRIDRVLHECDARRLPPLHDIAPLMRASSLASDAVWQHSPRAKILRTEVRTVAPGVFTVDLEVDCRHPIVRWAGRILRRRDRSSANLPR